MTQVKSYYRKDGTYVSSHYRRPRNSYSGDDGLEEFITNCIIILWKVTVFTISNLWHILKNIVKIVRDRTNNIIATYFVLFSCLVLYFTPWYILKPFVFALLSTLIYTKIITAHLRWMLMFLSSFFILKQLGYETAVNSVISVLVSVLCCYAATYETNNIYNDYVCPRNDKITSIVIDSKSIPLHTASDKDTVEHQISIGANVNAKDRKGRTPLHCAKNSMVAKALLAHDADVNIKDKTGKTPLHSAQNALVAKTLLENHADVNALDNKGRTPLHYATSINTAKLLIKYGADPYALDYSGLSPEDTMDSTISSEIDIYCNK